MKHILTLCLVLLLSAPLAAAEEEGYFVAAGVTSPSHGKSAEAAAPGCAGPDGLEESAAHNAQAVWDGTTRWGLPYLAPGCLAVDTSAGDTAPDAQASYDLATGAYTLHAAGAPEGFGGRTGLYVKFDCRECEPPWAFLLP